MSKLRFGVIAVNHDHIFGQCEALLEAGAEMAGFYAPEDDLAAHFMAKMPMAKRVGDRRQLLDDPTVSLIVTAAIPGDRAGICIEAMRHGKDAMTDKPGVTSFEQLAEVMKVQKETGRIFSICYSEHFRQRATVKAGELVHAGAIGQVINIVGLGPHRLRNHHRPDWFFTRSRYGGVICDIASHQCAQYLFFSGDETAEVLSASVRNVASPDRPGFQDFGDFHLKSAHATGYHRVDWFTPDGLPTWGDGRLFIVGTEGTIELRKYVDIAGRPGGDHLFLVNRTGMQHIDCSQTPLPYGLALVADVLNRTETAMPQARTFEAMRLALTAQALAEQTSGWSNG